VDGGVESKLRQDLRQKGSQPKAAATVHFRPASQDSLELVEPLLELIQQRLARQQRQVPLAVLAPDQPHAPRLQGGPKRIQR